MTQRCWCGRDLLVRTELANRRGGYNFEFSHDGQRYSVSVREYAGRPLEIFINGAKIDSSNDLIVRDVAVVLSIMLQYGVPLSDLAQSALGRNVDGTPSSPIGALIEILARGETERGEQQK
jgi:hypothetical protein